MALLWCFEPEQRVASNLGTPQLWGSLGGETQRAVNQQAEGLASQHLTAEINLLKLIRLPVSWAAEQRDTC